MRSLALIPLWFFLSQSIIRAQEPISTTQGPAQAVTVTGALRPADDSSTHELPSGEALTRQQAEELALKNNPRITVATLLALAQKQVVREVRSAELPQLNGNITGVDSEEATRLSSGSLAASRLLYHVGAGVDLNQLITDFGHTHNFIASSALQAKASEQNAQATREDIVLAVDLAFYNALEAQATLAVAKSTVNARQTVGNQVNALTASNLKSTLDQSFAQANVSQAQLLNLDSQNQFDAAMASLNEVLGTTDDRRYDLVDDANLPPPVASSVEEVITLALQQRPDLRALKLEPRGRREVQPSAARAASPHRFWSGRGWPNACRLQQLFRSELVWRCGSQYQRAHLQWLQVSRSKPPRPICERERPTSKAVCLWIAS